MLALSVALSLALGQLPAPQLGELGNEVTLRAQSAEYDFEENLVRAEGDVVLESGGLRLRSDSMLLDVGAREATASGGLQLLDGSLLVFAREGSLTFADRSVRAYDAVAYQKQSAEEARRAAAHPGLARTIGRNAMMLEAAWLERQVSGRILARSLRVSPCDCDGRAEWSVLASSASITPGSGAVLYWPRVYVGRVPIFAFPALYVPLSSRRSGLLIPRFGKTDANGLFIDQPFFVTLGESYDLTLTLGYRVGVKQTTDFFASFFPDITSSLEERRWVLLEPFDSPDRQGMRGVRGVAEFRYAPHVSTAGSLRLAGIDDRNGTPRGDPPTTPPRGGRGEIAWTHSTQSDGPWVAKADVHLVSDAYYLQDDLVGITADVTPYLRSQGRVDLRQEGMLATVGSSWYQDLNRNFPVLPGGQNPELWFFRADGIGAVQRPAFGMFELPRTRLSGRLWGSAEVVAEHYTPVGDLWQSPGTETLPIGALSLTRVHVAPRAGLPLMLGPVAAEAWAGVRGDLSSYGGADPASFARGRLLGGVTAKTELARSFGSGQDALRHTIVPRVELRAATRTNQGMPATTSATSGTENGRIVPNDEFGPNPYVLGGNPAFVQAIAAVSTSLHRRGGASIGTLELGQGADFLNARAGDTFGRLSLFSRYAGANLQANYNLDRGAFVNLEASGSVRDGRGDELGVNYQRLLEGGSDRMSAWLDELIGLRRLGSTLFLQGESFAPFAMVTPWRGASLRYEPRFTYALLEGKHQWQLLSHTGTLSLGSRCDCWKLDVFFSVSGPDASPDYGFLFELKNFGAIGI